MNRPRPLIALLVLLALILALGAPGARAWSYKEHIQITRLAVMRIVHDPAAPADLVAWLREQTPLLESLEAERTFLIEARVGADPDPTELAGLIWWVCVPDLEAGSRSDRRVDPFGQHERLMHYIDLEFFKTPPGTGVYQHDLSAKPAFTDIPRDRTDVRFLRAGYLPLATEYSYQQLVRTLRAGALKPDPEHIEHQDHALRWAGYLLHYIQDSTQPHHATVDYKSNSYFPDLRSKPNIHSEVEWKLVDDPEQPLTQLRTEYWDLLSRELSSELDPTTSTDPFVASLEVSFFSYDALPLIGSAAVASWDGSRIDTEAFFRFEGNVGNQRMRMLDMKARQVALAVRRSEAMLRQAWADAHTD